MEKARTPADHNSFSDRELAAAARVREDRMIGAGWSVTIALLLLLIAIVVFSAVGWVPNPFGDSEIAFAATVLGVSIAFTGVLVACASVVLKSYDQSSDLRHEIIEIERHIETGRRHAAAIQRLRSRLGQS